MNAPDFKQCLQWYSDGDFVLTEQGCRQSLARNPDDAAMLNLLGSVLLRKGEAAQALDSLTNAAALAPRDTDVLFNLALAQEGLHRQFEAIQTYRSILQQQSHHLRAMHNLIEVLDHTGQLEEAAELTEVFASKLQQQDWHSGVASRWMQEGLEQIRQGRFDVGLMRLRRARQIDPTQPALAYNLGNALQTARLFDAALAQYEDARRLGLEIPELGCNMGIVLTHTGRLDEALAVLQEGIQRCPSYLTPYPALSYVLLELGRPAEAQEILAQAVSLITPVSDPLSSARLYAAYGMSLVRQREHASGLAQLDKAVTLVPAHAELIHMKLMAHSYVETDPTKLQAIHVGAWPQTDRRIVQVHSSSHSRPLRAGIVSPDFRDHSVAYFIEPLFEHHDPRTLSITAYFNHLHDDHVTQRIKKTADAWCNVAALDTQCLAQTIQADGIDVLIDLAGHTQGNRLDVFIARAAPLQISYLGYPTGTGLPTMDYRLTDSVIDPADAPAMTCEKPARLAHHFCYRPPRDAPALRQRKGNGVVFGSFNNLSKITDATLDLWCQLLLAVPESRLMLKTKGIGSTRAEAGIRAHAHHYGIDVERILLQDWVKSTTRHLDLYNSIDVALDTYPYNGATTTCEALWMGTPVVTLMGTTHPSRMGASLLTSVGLTEWIASSSQQYVEIAQTLVADRGELAYARDSLRERLSNSALCDGVAFSRNFEALLTRLAQSQETSG